jgi:PAS domain S-box-containing protein
LALLATSSFAARLAHGDISILTELLDILGEAITIRDTGGEIVYANRAALAHLGFDSMDELQRRSSASIMDDYIVEDEHGEPLTLADVPSVRLMRDEPAAPLLMRVVHRVTGEVRWNLLKATALRGEDRSFLGAITVIEDVSAVKTAEVRTRILAESGRILASSLEYQETLRNVANIAVPALADWCAVDLVDTENRREHVVTTHRDPAKQQLARRLRELEPNELDTDHAVGRVLRTGVSELYPDVTDEQLLQGARSDEHLRMLRELGMRSVVIVPLRVPARTLGLMTLVTAESRRRLNEEDLALAEQLGRRAAVAVENSRLHTTLAGLAHTLQQSLLPNRLPDLPGWQVASLFRPAESEQRIDVGGDFYEFIEHDGTWFVPVGDVTGKGVAAASVTALMRHGARFASRFEPEPRAILGRLDEALRQQPSGALCTAMCFCLHDDHIVISSAGHPPAMIADGRGGVREAPAPGPLLGAFADAHWPEQTVPIAADELLLLYTDGVVETRGDRERFGSARLRALLAQHAAKGPAEVLDRLDEALNAFRHGPGRDDVLALALKRTPGSYVSSDTVVPRRSTSTTRNSSNGSAGSTVSSSANSTSGEGSRAAAGGAGGSPGGGRSGPICSSRRDVAATIAKLIRVPCAALRT